MKRHIRSLTVAEANMAIGAVFGMCFVFGWLIKKAISGIKKKSNANKKALDESVCNNFEILRSEINTMDNNTNLKKAIELNTKTFRKNIVDKLHNMTSDYIDINAGAIHREIGGYPGKKHRMPICCNVMESLRINDDTVLRCPPKGKGASLTIRYFKHNHNCE